MLSFKFESVYAITDYVDGILAGVGDYHGKPHVFLLAHERPAIPDAPPLYSLWSVEWLPSSRQTRSDIWDPPQELLALVACTVCRFGQPNLRARGNFQPASAMPTAGLPPTEIIVAWQEWQSEGA